MKKNQKEENVFRVISKILRERGIKFAYEFDTYHISGLGKVRIKVTNDIVVSWLVKEYEFNKVVFEKPFHLDGLTHLIDNLKNDGLVSWQLTNKAGQVYGRGMRKPYDREKPTELIVFHEWQKKHIEEIKESFKEKPFVLVDYSKTTKLDFDEQHSKPHFYDTSLAPIGGSKATSWNNKPTRFEFKKQNNLKLTSRDYFLLTLTIVNIVVLITSLLCQKYSN